MSDSRAAWRLARKQLPPNNNDKHSGNATTTTIFVDLSQHSRRRSAAERDARDGDAVRNEHQIDAALANHVKFRALELLAGRPLTYLLLVDVGALFGGSPTTLLATAKTMFELEHSVEMLAFPQVGRSVGRRWPIWRAVDSSTTCAQAPIVRAGVVSRLEPVASSALLLHRVRSVRAVERWRQSFYSARFSHLDQALFEGVLLKGDQLALSTHARFNS